MTFYLIAQMVGAGVLIQALVGIDFSLAVIITGVFMLCYVIFGGMVATTWVQIVKAVLLMAGILVMSIFVLGKVGFNPIELFNRAEANTTAESTFSLGPGTYLPKPLDTVSLGLALVLGTAGLPHILMRFFTVPNAKAARSSRRLGDVHHRLLLPADDVHRLRRARVPGRGRRRGRGQGRQPRRAEPGGVPRRRRGDVRRRPVPGAASRASRSRRSSPWSPASC